MTIYFLLRSVRSNLVLYSLYIIKYLELKKSFFFLLVSTFWSISINYEKKIIHGLLVLVKTIVQILHIIVYKLFILNYYFAMKWPVNKIIQVHNFTWRTIVQISKFLRFLNQNITGTASINRRPSFQMFLIFTFKRKRGKFMETIPAMYGVCKLMIEYLSNSI